MRLLPLLRACLAALLLAAACAAPPAAPTTPLHLVVLHTNDIHGQLLPGRAGGGLRRAAARVEALRRELGPDEALLVLDGGDWFQGTPEGRVDGGAAFLGLLRGMDYDALAIGNHELDHGVEHLAALLAQLDLPAVCANVFDPRTGERAPLGQPYRIVERGGVRIALVGLLTTETPVISHASTRRLSFADPVETLGRMMEELEGRADIVLPVTHLGVPDDTRLAQAFEVPLIVGGHSHTRLPEGLAMGRTTIVQAGSKAAVLGRVDLWIERPAMRVARVEARLLALDEEGPLEPAFAAACDALAARAEEGMGEVVGVLAGPLELKGGLCSSSSAGNLVADLFRERSGADIGLHNKGGLRTSLPAGPVTRRDLFELLPFDNTLVVASVTGDELFEALRRAVEGREHAGIEVSGLRLLVAEPGAPATALRGAEVAGEPLDAGRTYRVAMNSFMAGGGDGYFEPDVEVVLDTGLLLRDVLEDALRERGSLAPADDERFVRSL